REGIEIVRNMRDSNWMIASEVWNEGFGYSASNFDSWGGDEAVPLISNVVNKPISLDWHAGGVDPFNIFAGLYRYSQVYLHSDGRFLQGDQGEWAAGNLGTPTNFSRVIYFNPICWHDPAAVPLILPSHSINTNRQNTNANDCATEFNYPNEVGMQVRVEVRWPQYTGNYHSVILEERLYDWR
ncbi:hypothetical protein ACFL0L_04265, partial [Patescibacteria group bacterium]